MAGMFDARIQQQADLEKSALNLASIPRGRVSVYGAGLAGGMAGQADSEQDQQNLVHKIFAEMVKPNA